MLANLLSQELHAMANATTFSTTLQRRLDNSVQWG